MTLPTGVRREVIDGEERLLTEGDPVYGEPTVDAWRVWDASRSKVAAMLERGLTIDIDSDARVLYLGAAAGTTVSHIADIARIVYAIEFAPRPARELLEVARNRSNIIPLLKDARKPDTYGHVVEAECDVLIQDVATRGQAEVACANRRFLADDGHLVCAIKARSEDVAASPETVFDAATETLAAEYDITETVRLDPDHRDHLAILARPA